MAVLQTAVLFGIICHINIPNNSIKLQNLEFAILWKYLCETFTFAIICHINIPKRFHKMTEFEVCHFMEISV